METKVEKLLSEIGKTALEMSKLLTRVAKENPTEAARIMRVRGAINAVAMTIASGAVEEVEERGRQMREEREKQGLKGQKELFEMHENEGT